MNQSLRRALESYIIDNFVNFEEYQNKYFLKKKIQEIMPEATDEKVYLAIEKTNYEVKAPRRKKEYIDFLLRQLQV